MLTGSVGNGSVHLYSSRIDKLHIYIPQNNPVISKLTGLALGAINENRPDIIWASYLEPYGIVAMLVSLLTGIPYIVRHAGSDIARLMLTDQLHPTYLEVLRRASLILTGSRLIGRFLSLGLDAEKLLIATTTYLHPSYFKPDDRVRENPSPFLLGIYGKVGREKGSFSLLSALEHLKNKDWPFELRAHWGGKNLGSVRDKVSELGLQEHVRLLPFIPHWMIPSFIHECDLLLFLEHGFGIKIHTPGIPMEILSCGRPLLTTFEIANSPRYAGILKNLENCLVINDPTHIDELVDLIQLAYEEKLRRKLSENASTCFDLSLQYEHAKRSVAQILLKALQN